MRLLTKVLRTDKIDENRAQRGAAAGQASENRGGIGIAIDIVITRKGIFKKALTEADLCPAGLRMGHWNQAGVLDDGPAADGRVLCDGGRPGRGCFLQALPGEKGRVALRQTLPCTKRDLEVFYGLVRHICRLWGAVRFTQDGEEHRLGDIPALKEGALKGCAGLLQVMAERWQADGEGVLTGAVYPLYPEPETIARLGKGDVDFFEDYLARKQTGDRYYAKPSFYRLNDGAEILGMYAITEGVESILPAAPFVPPLYSVFLQDFHLRDEQVTHWQVALNRVWVENGEMKGENLGYVPFADFAERAGLSQRTRFDAKHVFVTVDNIAQMLP